jgi:hypothetical protein
MAGLTGQVAGQATLAGRQQQLAEEEARWQRELARSGMTGRMTNAEQTLAGRAQSLEEELGRGRFGLEQQQAGQSWQAQQAGLLGSFGGQQTLAGREQALREQESQRNWQFQLAQMQANPANAAVTAIMSGGAPWQRALMSGASGGSISPQGAASSGAFGTPTARTMGAGTYESMTPSERDAFLSMVRADQGIERGDYEAMLSRYRPQGRTATATRWR